MIKKISVENFIKEAVHIPVFDVRSPSEYSHACFPGAYSLPLFDDEERRVVGTAYKQEGKQPAIKIGLDFFGGKMKAMIEQVETVLAERKSAEKKILVHCWRGGMRSAGVAWLLDLYGFEVLLLEGGYKAYRRWVLTQFEKEYSLKILGGYTGSAKTELLQSMKKMGLCAIDLEGLAHHKGSAFGGIGQLPQPSQEMFENKLALLLSNCEESIWLEDESQRIGSLIIPNAFWKTMRNAPLFFLEVPFTERLEYILINYGPLEREKLIESVGRIYKRFGPLETTTTINLLKEGRIREAFALLLRYYDKAYLKSMNMRHNLKKLLHKIPTETIEIEINQQKLLSSVN